MTIDQEKLTFLGSMNHIVGARKLENGSVELTNYQPRKERVVLYIEENPEKVKKAIEESIERLKIAITLFEEFLNNERDLVYYWERNQSVQV
jgi:hypothetical protein